MKFSKMSDEEFLYLLESYIDNNDGFTVHTHTTSHISSTISILKYKPMIIGLHGVLFTKKELKNIFHLNYFMINLLSECERRITKYYELPTLHCPSCGINHTVATKTVGEDFIDLSEKFLKTLVCKSCVHKGILHV